MVGTSVLKELKAVGIVYTVSCVRKNRNSQFHGMEVSHSLHAKKLYGNFTQQKKKISAFPENLLDGGVGAGSGIIISELSYFIFI